MKRFLLSAMVAILAVSSVSAQSDEPKQEIAVSVGQFSNSDWLNIFEIVVEAVFGEKYNDGSFVGPISMEYYYHIKPWIGVGAMAVYGQLSQDSQKDGEKVGQKTNRYFTVMPAVKFDWLRRDVVGLYSKLGVGATLRNEKREFDGERSKYNSDKTDVHVNWQVSLIGVELGKSLRGFAELGFGEQGVAQIGVRYRF